MRGRAVAAAAVLVATFANATVTEQGDAYREISRHYEEIRLSLMQERLEGVSIHAEEISRIASETAADFTPERVGVGAESADAARQLLPQIRDAADRMSRVEELEALRDGFFELSKPLGRLRKLAGIDETSVIFCPMAKKAWIQPREAELGNPYMGPAMSSCGSVIAD